MMLLHKKKKRLPPKGKTHMFTCLFAINLFVILIIILYVCAAWIINIKAEKHLTVVEILEKNAKNSTHGQKN